MTEQLLAFSREQKLRPETVDVHERVRAYESVLKRAVGETIALAISAGASLWPCRVDPVQFETALLNLVLNARDAMPRDLRPPRQAWDFSGLNRPRAPPVRVSRERAVVSPFSAPARP
ncbi:MAG TPA: hypothetical protein VF502_05350 [Stellaceae bacterium]